MINAVPEGSSLEAGLSHPFLFVSEHPKDFLPNKCFGCFIKVHSDGFSTYCSRVGLSSEQPAHFSVHG